MSKKVSLTTEISCAREDLKFHSEQVSKLNRQMALAGIGIIWIFRKDVGSADVPSSLILPLFLFVLSLILDVGYHSSVTFHLNKVLDCADRLAPQPDKVYFPGKLLKFYGIFYWSRLVPMVAGYIFVVCYMTRKYI